MWLAPTLLRIQKAFEFRTKFKKTCFIFFISLVCIFLLNTMWFLMRLARQPKLSSNRDTRFLLSASAKGVAERTKTFILAVDFTGEAEQQPVRWLPTLHCDSANVWYRIIFSLYASATSAFSRLPLTVILIIFFWIHSLPLFPPGARVNGKRLRRLFNETFPRFSNAKRWKRSETVGESASEKRQRFGRGEEGSISAIQ